MFVAEKLDDPETVQQTVFQFKGFFSAQHQCESVRFHQHCFNGHQVTAVRGELSVNLDERAVSESVDGLCCATD